MQLPRDVLEATFQILRHVAVLRLLADSRQANQFANLLESVLLGVLDVLLVLSSLGLFFFAISFLVDRVGLQVLVDFFDLRQDGLLLRNLCLLSLVGLELFLLDLLNELLDLVQLLVAVADLLPEVLLERTEFRQNDVGRRGGILALRSFLGLGVV